MQIIEELWIFSKHGIPILDFRKDTEIHDGLFESFVTAIKLLLKQSTKKEIKSFSMGDKKFYFRTVLEDNITIVIRASTSAVNDEIDKLFNKISNLFEETYTIDEIVNWYGNNSFFAGIREKIALFFQNSAS